MGNKIVLTFFILIFIISCNKGYEKISFVHYLPETNNKNKVEYQMTIPKGYEYLSSPPYDYLKTDSCILRQYMYWIKNYNQCVLYISDFPHTFTYGYGLIDSIELEKKQKVYNNTESSKIDTLKFEGKDGDNSFWKEIVIGKVSFGYYSIHPKLKKKFDKILNSIEKK